MTQITIYYKVSRYIYHVAYDFTLCSMNIIIIS